MIAMRSVLGRWQLNGRGFLNDPDVFILRDKNNRLSPTQQHTILTLNALLGRLLFTSDFVGDYSDEQSSEYLGAVQWMDAEILRVTQHATYYEIAFTKDGQSFRAYANLWKQVASIKVGQGNFELAPYETIVLKA
jgi:alpha-galactosidase